MRQLTLTAFAGFTLLSTCMAPPADAQSASSTLNRWTRTADLSAARSQACAAVLKDGRLLVVGGLGDRGPVGNADIYAASGVFTPTAPMNQARARAACATLPDGRVLVSGGNDGTASLDTAEIYNPSAGTWQPAGNLATAREGHQMAITSWGDVWVAGGTSNGAITGALELFSAATLQFRQQGSLQTPRNEFAMAAAGRMLVIAGGTDGNTVLSSVEIFDGALGSMTVAGALNVARKDFAAAALLDGTILMAGGVDINGATLSSTEIFDPVKGISSAGPVLLEPRAFHSAYPMKNNGGVLIYGGSGNSGVLGTTEIYTPWTGGISKGSPLNSARRDEAKAAVHAGAYMVAGGRNDQGLIGGSELFQFSTIATDKADYKPGTAVNISGGGWIPGEQVLVTIEAFPIDQHRTEFTGAAVADGAGNITVPGFAVDKSHLGMKFLMTALGSVSEAQTTFTDALVDPTIGYAFNPASGTAVPGPVDITVTLTPNPAITGPVPTGTVTICTQNVCPTGLTVTADAGYSCTGAVCTLKPTGSNNTANASFKVTFPAGTTAFSVVYSGDTNYNVENPTAGSTPPGAPIVNYTAQYFTTTNLTGGPASPAPFGTQTPYTANVCPSTSAGGACNVNGTITGTVQFLVNGVASGSPVTINGTANGAGSQVSVNFIPSPSLAVGGPYAITASYSGDTGNLPSNSTTANGGAGTIFTTIQKSPANFTISSSNTAPGGSVVTTNPVALTATYTGGLTPAPSGSVTFINTAQGNAAICTATLSSGVATCSPNATAGAAGLPIGAATVSITYVGDSNYSLGTVTPFSFTVAQAPTTTTLTASVTPPENPVSVGHTVTLTAVVTATGVAAGATLVPSGAVTITPPATNAGSSTCATPTAGATTLTSITYTCTFVAQGPVGPAGVTVSASASYAGDASTISRNGSTNINIQDVATSTTLTFTSVDSTNPNSPTPTFAGHVITFTAVTTTTTANAAVQPTPGNITITPPAGNSSPVAVSCAAPTLVSSTATSVTVDCIVLLTGPFASLTPGAAQRQRYLRRQRE